MRGLTPHITSLVNIVADRFNGYIAPASASGYVRKRAEVRKNPPRAEVVAAYQGSLDLALARGDFEWADKLRSKIASL